MGLFRKKKKVKKHKRLLTPAPEMIGNSPISVGRGTYGFCNITVHQWNEGAALRIGSFCSIAAEVTVLLGGNHRTDWATTYPFGRICVDRFGGEAIAGQHRSGGDVVIGNDVWIGHGTSFVSGVTIGDGAVIAANSHVVKDIPPYYLAGGNPARPIKPRFDTEITALLQQLAWWELPDEAIRAIAPTLCATPDVVTLRQLLQQYRP